MITSDHHHPSDVISGRRIKHKPYKTRESHDSNDVIWDACS